MFAEDLTAFFQADEFAVTAQLDGLEVVGIFDNAYDTTGIGVADIAGTNPLFTLPTSAVPARPVGKVLVVAGTSWRIVDHQPDGTGVSQLRLER
jgi:hypothetical protein